MQAVAKLKNVTMSARKMRLVVDNIRGKKVEDAINILRFTKKEAAVWLEKLVRSAVANWEYKLEGNESADDYNLYIKTAFCDGGTIVKRFRPAPHGRAHRIRKRSNHVTIIVENRIAVPGVDDQGVVVEEVEQTN
ncbi:MAG TPA: 50S ribosomal protein L22 [Haliscomenobacter sp.]|uniref:Large ribosomal subunit protein uL22 n=1 Tax=Haliscomenobacter hydrossis (strain ATCC 27775 / DSM 1100 / LMG 10767 / O) TaxID=760192 RepID=F4KWU8_HALH1|nr:MULTISPECIES: 50S ribosomal protein L22 [Haliscomenobacter]AEE52581.1 ribosomal protein L22 [Haliscomenobacter hydrossis DSM 1100]MBK9491511.1 50S ribosomal protein L22 [Haliscomenobacter sp.]HOY18319.1 50S ribosomal protein L22 [Haliscomenobacter sp.]